VARFSAVVLGMVPPNCFDDATISALRDGA